MSIDDRGRRAAEGLQRSVQAQVSPERALTELQARPLGWRPGRGPGSMQRLVVGIAAVSLLIAAVGVAVAASHTDSGSTKQAVKQHHAPKPPKQPDQQKLIQEMPSSPIDGKQSWGLPVLAFPQAGIVDGQSVLVVGKGFEPNAEVGVVYCGSEAGAGVGVDACQLGTGFDAVAGEGNADATGMAQVEVHAERFITTPRDGRIDCEAVAERCLVAMADVDNYDRSGGSFLYFKGSPAFPPASATVTPATNLSPGQSVIVQAHGIVPTRGETVSECLGDQCALRLTAKADAQGVITTGIQVYPTFTDNDGVTVTCNDKCVVQVNGYGGVKGASSAPQPAVVPISFNPAAPAAASPPPSTFPPTAATLPGTIPAPTTFPGVSPATSVPVNVVPVTPPATVSPPVSGTPTTGIVTAPPMTTIQDPVTGAPAGPTTTHP